MAKATTTTTTIISGDFFGTAARADVQLKHGTKSRVVNQKEFRSANPELRGQALKRAYRKYLSVVTTVVQTEVRKNFVVKAVRPNAKGTTVTVTYSRK